jgi:hypothetical protein
MNGAIEIMDHQEASYGAIPTSEDALVVVAKDKDDEEQQDRTSTKLIKLRQMGASRWLLLPATYCL